MGTTGTASSDQNLRMVLDFELDSFSESDRRKFIVDLAIVAGVSLDEIVNVTFSEGCVIFEATLSPAAVKRLKDLFDDRNSGEPRSEQEEFLAFLVQYNVKQISDYAIQVHVVKKTDQRPLAILVHGWRGDESSFGDLPTFITKRTGSEAVLFQYPSGLIGHSPSTVFLARNLENFIRTYTDGRTIAFIAHSLGGVVVRKLLTNQMGRKNRIDSTVRQITMVASPHNGVPLSTLVKYIPGFSNLIDSQQLRELEPGSPLLVDLNSRWLEYVEERTDLRVNTRCIYGTADKIVDPQNASGLDPHALPILNADHIGIVKPTKASDEIVMTIARLFKEAGVSGFQTM